MGHRSAIELEDAQEAERQRQARADRDDYLEPPTDPNLYSASLAAERAKTDPDAAYLRGAPARDPLAQPPPIANDQPAAWDLVLEDMRQRDEFGRRKYGTRLQPHNGRDALSDAYAEALDLAVYLRLAIFERDGK